ncbi:HWE histidine kinase domain-containing protein [Castellaniella sp.]|uniref:HWE histidine kinase domain-containing protein n=1 Tax=Castellaniella sp. TaxID=1955812 RepID=UPI002AFED212|nr:HWE histidine kinase domain-containing protein [Castellaniella sp.]
MSDNALKAAIANCEGEPIHTPGAILPHGALLVCDPVSLQLRYFSRNFAELTSYPGKMFPGLSASDLLGQKALHDLRNAMAATGARSGAGIVPGLRLPWSDLSFDIMMHRHAGAMLIELEPSTDEGQSADRALDMTRQLIGRLARATEPRSLFDMGARLAQAMLGFDRVMIYRFQHDGAGKVVAEDRMSGMDSFMGHHFPPGDIPPQARALYVANPIRAIPNASYQPVPLDPPLLPGDEPVDLSHAQLRSVSPVHCEYLRNMGISASLSISLIVEGRLWGLIACHHRAPRTVPPSLRVSAELFGHYFALQIATTEHREAMRIRGETRRQLDHLMAGITDHAPLVTSLSGRLPSLAALLGCHGAALLRSGTWTATTDQLPRETGLRLLGLARSAAPKQIWHSQEIAAEHRDIVAKDGIAGALVIPLSDSDDDALFLFRRSEAHDVDWAGAPSKMVAEISGRVTLSPRRSFSLWREKVLGRSVPWSEDDLVIAEALRSWLRDAVLTETEATSRDREEASRRRSLINEELNHRIKNVMSLVKSIALQTGASAGSVSEYSRVLEGRLQALACAHDRSLGESGGSLSDLIEAEAVLHRSEAVPDRVLVAGPDLYLSDKAYGVLALVIHEMMTNSMKYGALSIPEGRLTIQWALDPGIGLMMDWRERGGPEVLPPRRTGFGSRLIRNSMEYDLKGHAEIDFDPLGLTSRFVIPARHLTLQEESTPPSSPDPEPAASLHGLSILVVEDQSLIALDTEETLRQLGARDVRLVSNGVEALALLGDFRPDLSVLDFNLGEETSEAVAATLMSRQSPFIFVTGYSDQISPSPHFSHVPVIRKPVSSASIAVNIAAALAAVGDR